MLHRGFTNLAASMHFRIRRGRPCRCWMMARRVKSRNHTVVSLPSQWHSPHDQQTFAESRCHLASSRNCQNLLSSSAERFLWSVENSVHNAHPKGYVAWSNTPAFCGVTRICQLVPITTIIRDSFDKLWFSLKKRSNFNNVDSETFDSAQSTFHRDPVRKNTPRKFGSYSVCHKFFPKTWK